MRSGAFYVDHHEAGLRSEVQVRVYRTTKHVQAAAHRFNPSEPDDGEEILAVTQLETNNVTGEQRVTLRFAEERLTMREVVHEVHHAALSLHRIDVPADTPVDQVLTHYNEDAAYLFGGLLAKVMDELTGMGYTVPMERWARKDD